MTGKFRAIRLGALMKSVKCMRPVVTKALASSFLWPFIILHRESWKQKMVLSKIQCRMNVLHIRWAQGLEDRAWDVKEGVLLEFWYFQNKQTKAPRRWWDWIWDFTLFCIWWSSQEKSEAFSQQSFGMLIYFTAMLLNRFMTVWIWDQDRPLWGVLCRGGCRG